MSTIGQKSKLRVPIVDLISQYKGISSEVEDAIKGVLNSGSYILGSNVSLFEEELAKYLGCKHVISCANGTDALVLALRALDIGQGDEVITTSHSYYATTEAIVLVGAKPVFVDILEEDFNIDPSKIESAITKNTKAIIPVHLYGQSCEIKKVIEIANKHNLYVIEDCAQSLGAKYENKMTGTFGNIGTTSFYPTKNLGAYGDGGAIFTDDDKIAQKLKMLRNHGLSKRYVHDLIGTNSRLDEIQATVLRIKLKYLAQWNNDRCKAAQYYNTLLKNVTNLITPFVKSNCTHIFNQYSVRVPKRDFLCEELKKRDIDTLIYYPIPIHKQKLFKESGKNYLLPVTEKVCNEILSLPIYPEITHEIQGYVTEAIQDIML